MSDESASSFQTDRREFSREWYAHRRDMPISTLLEWIDLHDPAKGAASETGKADLADFAIGYAACVMGNLIRWAINHKVGEILAGIEQPMPFEAEMRSLLNREGADSHDLERKGASYGYDDPVMNRRILAEMLRLFRQLLPHQLGTEFSWGLIALDHGEVVPALTPKKNKGGKYTLARHRLRAVEHLAFRTGRGDTWDEAKQAVGNAYGVAPDTLQSWHRRAADLCKISSNQSKVGPKQISENPNDASPISVPFHEIVFTDACLSKDGKVYNHDRRRFKVK